MAAMVMIHKWWHAPARGAAPDGYRVMPCQPYAAGHRLLDGYLADSASLTRRTSIAAGDLQSGRVILAAEPHLQIDVVHAILDRVAWLEQGAPGPLGLSSEARDRYIRVLDALLGVLLARHLPYADGDLCHVLAAQPANRGAHRSA